MFIYLDIEGNRSAKCKVNHDLGGAKRVASQPFAKITIDPEPCMTMLPGEAMKKQPVFGRLLSMSAIYVQGSAMASVGEWRDEVGCSKLTSISLKRAVR